MAKKAKKVEYKEEPKPVEAASVAPAAADDEKDSWEHKRMLDVLMEAEEIKGDPKKMEKVHKLAGRKMGAIKSIQDLKDLYEAKSANGDFKNKV
jgi:tellurite resistance protein